MKRGWAIFDRKRQYIPVVYQTEDEALEELRELLLPYPEGHEWRRRLRVDFVDAQPLVLTGEPVYGYRYVKSKHGLRQAEDGFEQRVIRFVRKMVRLGDTPEQITTRLNARGWLPRHGHRFTVQQVKELIEAAFPRSSPQAI